MTQVVVREVDPSELVEAVTACPVVVEAIEMLNEVKVMETAKLYAFPISPN
jgi:hypothetical protein